MENHKYFTSHVKNFKKFAYQMEKHVQITCDMKKHIKIAYNIRSQTQFTCSMKNLLTVAHNMENHTDFTRLFPSNDLKISQNLHPTWEALQFLPTTKKIMYIFHATKKSSKICIKPENHTQFTCDLKNLTSFAFNVETHTRFTVDMKKFSIFDSNRENYRQFTCDLKKSTKLATTWKNKINLHETWKNT